LWETKSSDGRRHVCEVDPRFTSRANWEDLKAIARDSVWLMGNRAPPGKAEMSGLPSSRPNRPVRRSRALPESSTVQNCSSNRPEANAMASAANALTSGQVAGNSREASARNNQSSPPSCHVPTLRDPRERCRCPIYSATDRHPNFSVGQTNRGIPVKALSGNKPAKQRASKQQCGIMQGPPQ